MKLSDLRELVRALEHCDGDIRLVTNHSDTNRATDFFMDLEISFIDDKNRYREIESDNEQVVYVSLYSE